MAEGSTGNKLNWSALKLMTLETLFRANMLREMVFSINGLEVLHPSLKRIYIVDEKTQPPTKAVRDK